MDLSTAYTTLGFVNEGTSIYGYEIGYLLYDLNISKTYDLNTSGDITYTDYLAVKYHDEQLGKLLVKDADEWTQYIRYPKINIVRIEGELILSK